MIIGHRPEYIVKLTKWFDKWKVTCYNDKGYRCNSISFKTEQEAREFAIEQYGWCQN